MPETTAPVLLFTHFDKVLLFLVPLGAAAVFFQWRRAARLDHAATAALVLRYPKPLFTGALLAAAAWLVILTVAPHVLIDTAFRAVAVPLFLTATLGCLLLAAHAISYRYRVCEEG